MIAACLTAALTALVSAFFPVTPVEPYLVGLAAATNYSPIALGLAAALGQTIGKTTLFLGVRGALHSDRLRGWVDAAERRRERRRASRCGQFGEGETGATESGAPAGTRTATKVRERLRAPLAPVVAVARKLLALLDKPALAAPILLLSAVTGMPPLMATSICAAGTKINLPVFVTRCFVVRSIRFIAIAYAPQLVLSWTP
jgi:membrane protein YqaA with SNARE-associated domain